MVWYPAAAIALISTPNLFGSFLSWKFAMKTGNSLYLRQLFSFVLLAFLLFASTNNVADAKPAASVVHDIQFILALKGLYKGPLDGKCDAQTIAAIARYAESAHEKQIFPIQCNDELLATLIGDISEALSATKAVPPLANQQQKITTEFSHIQENYHSELVSQFRQLATLSATIIAFFLTGLWFIGTTLAKTLIEKVHERQWEKIEQQYDELLKTSTSTFDSMIVIARSQTAAYIHASLGNYCTALYMTLKTPNTGPQKELYEAYLNLTVELTHYAFLNSEHMRQFIKTSKSTPTDDQIMLSEACLNNYAYFLAPKTLQNNEGAISAKVELKKLLRQLAQLDDSGPQMLEPWRLKHTIAWVTLHLNRNLREFEDAIISLIDDVNIPQSWKDEVRKKHAQHRLAHPDLYNKLPAAPATPSHPSA
jgi:uncharacterized membrane protein